MSVDLRDHLRTQLAHLGTDVESRIDAWLGGRGPVAFRATELEVAALTREFADEAMACILRHLVADPTLQAQASLTARQSGSFRHGGTREVGVTLLGGKDVRLEVEYIRPDLRGRPGRRRKVGKRGKGGAGVYPVLAALGIWYGVTPALAGEVCRQVADSDSVRAGRAALARRGIDLGHKRTLRVVNKYGGRAVEQRNEWLQDARTKPPTRGVLGGQHVVVATDGGRLRERVNAPCGRKRAATGHRGYKAPWREPKLLTIYTIADDGKVTGSFAPVYDGTLGDADAIFAMLTGYLKALGAHEAQHLTILGDGAKWIWDRAPQLAAALGLRAEQVTQVIDWCHAVGVLHKIADVPATWDEADKEAWLRRAKRHLHAGRIDAVLALIDTLAVGRRAKAITEHRDYFVRNAARMQYAAFEAAHIPTGSGAIESAVRRVINMRLKSNGMFWLEVNAEGMLLLRSYLKSGYFDALIDWSLRAAVPWWQSHAANGHDYATPLGMQRAA